MYVTVFLQASHNTRGVAYIPYTTDATLDLPTDPYNPNPQLLHVNSVQYVNTSSVGKKHEQGNGKTVPRGNKTTKLSNKIYDGNDGSMFT